MRLADLPEGLSLTMLVSIDGPIGAGKSTLVGQLARRGYNVFSEPVQSWTLLEDFARDPEKHAFAFQMEILISYHKLFKSLKRDSLVVIERSPWSSSNVFFDMYVKDPLAKQMYEQQYGIYGFEPDAIVYLDVDAETSWERVRSRGRREEAGYTEDHVKNVVKRYADAIENTGIAVYKLDDCSTFEESAENILCKLQSQ